MKRLVYSPYVQAFVKTGDGVFDLSPYILNGSVNRKVNQVSSAQLTLRNPVLTGSGNLLLTEFPRSNGTGPLISPMDPIVIMMTRLQAHPVTVFTGYVDKAPYFQLYPGPCTLEASCTLKRLQYTQWDSSLPFVEYFLQQFGWQLGTNGIANPTADVAPLKGVLGGTVSGQFTDGSLGGLLFAILQYIGNWDESTIFIEALPPQIKNVVITLYNRIQSDVQQGSQFINTYLEQILGSSSHGSGGASGGGGVSTGTISNAAQVVPAIATSAARWGVPASLLVAIGLIENNLQPTSCTAGSYAGTFQVQWTGGGSGRNGHPYGSGPWSTHVPTCAEANDVGLASNACAGAAAGLKSSYGGTSDTALWNWAIHIQGVENNLGGQSAAYQTAAGFAPYLVTATALLAKYGSAPTTTHSQAGGATREPSVTTDVVRLGSSPTATAVVATDSVRASKAGRSPGGKIPGLSSVLTPSANANANGMINPIPGFSNFTYDKGIDCGAPVGSAILAPADCTLTQVDPTFYDGQPLMLFEFDNPIPQAPTQYWYVSEQINPVTTTLGTHFNQGDTVATFAATGSDIEIGWGSPSTYDLRYAPVEAHYGTTKTGWGFDFWKYFSIGGGNAIQGRVSGAGGGGSSINAAASAFSTMLALPSIFQIGEALAFTGKRSFMADQPLWPFVLQLCQASMRNCMSMPNGNFLAFFPDYFGIFGRKYYWEIHDIEIIDARIDLSDDPLATHVAVAGDTYTYPSGQVTEPDLLLTSGIFDIFDAFATGYVGSVADPSVDIHNIALGAGTIANNKSGTPQPSATTPNSAANTDALAFLQKFGARPLVEEIPAIRNPFFELFYAFQTFMLLWSKQFETTFELTFMPELFPGGLIGLPDHHIQLYVEEVIHYFDYAQGFTTTASVSSPSQLSTPSGTDPRARTNLSQGLTSWNLSTAIADATNAAGQGATSVSSQGVSSAGQGVVKGVGSGADNK